MRRQLAWLAISWILSFTAAAGTLPGINSIADHWPEGVKYIYDLYSDTARLGRVEATLESYERDGNKVVSGGIREKLVLDRAGGDQAAGMTVDGILKVDGAGRMLEAEIDVTIGDRKGKNRLVYDAAGGVVAVETDEESRPKTEINVSGPVFMVDDYMAHQLDIALAGQDFATGNTFTVPIVSGRRLFAVDCEFRVEGLVGASGHTTIDSVWKVIQIRPAQRSLYFDRRHRLVILEDRDSGLSARLTGLVQTKTPSRPEEPTVDMMSRFRDRLPIYGVYFLAAVIGVLFLGRGGYRGRWPYVCFLFGILVYPAVYVTHDPLQLLYGRAFLAEPGQSMVFKGIVPSLVTGLYHQGLKLVLLLIVSRLMRAKPALIISLGAFLGAGYGFFEACQTTLSPNKFLSTIFFTGNLFAILFHTATGAMLGYGIAVRRTVRFWLAASGLQALATYVWVFVDMSRPTVETFATIRKTVLWISLYNMVIMAGMFILQRSYYRKAARGRKKKR